MNKRAQISMEYLTIFAFVIILSIPLILIYSVQTKNVQEDVASAQIYRLLTKISDSAEDIYYQGPPSKKTIRISFPRGIENLTVNESYIEAYYFNGNTQISITKDSLAILNGTLRNFPGEHTITFTAEENRVRIEDK